MKRFCNIKQMNLKLEIERLSEAVIFRNTKQKHVNYTWL